MSVLDAGRSNVRRRPWSMVVVTNSDYRRDPTGSSDHARLNIPPSENFRNKIGTLSERASPLEQRRGACSEFFLVELLIHVNR